METRNLTDRIWMIVVGLLAVLLVAGAVRVFAAPADETFDAAREALNRAEYEKAIQLYRTVYEQDQRGELAAQALYWQAFANYKVGQQKHLQRALELLEVQREVFADSGTMSEAEALYARVTAALAREGDAHAARRVHEMAQSRDSHEREARLAALNALMMMDSKRALPILKKLLAADDTDIDLKRHALMVLSQVDEEQAVQILLGVVERETDPEMLAQSMFWLAQIGSEEAFDAVIKAYRRSDDEEVKQAALMAIGESDDRRAGDLLIEVVRDERLGTETRTHAAYALAQSDRDGLAPLFMDLFKTSQDTEFRSMIMYAMSNLDEPAPAAWFVKVINDKGEDLEVRRHALHHAGMLDLLDIDTLRSIYQADDDPEMRTQVCYVLSQIDDPQAVELAIEIVRDETDPEVRHQAIFWLGQFDDPRVVDFLVELIEED
ncbi:HEAT repeat domain-containing protein [bacterium]|nr:HEAT repeat domain-containing protein [bacterium]